MDETTFWKLIEESRIMSDGQVHLQAQLLIKRLQKLHTVDIATFHAIYVQQQNNAYTGELWDACNFITCGGGEQRFINFRAWLIAQGKSVYEAVVGNPDYLAKIIERKDREDVMYEEFAYVVAEAYEQKTDRSFSTAGIFAGSPKGEPLGEKDIESRFPNLFSKLGECDEI